MPRAEIAALNCFCVTKALVAGNAGDAAEFNAAEFNAVDLTNDEIVVECDALLGGLFDCGCCRAIVAAVSLPEVVAVLGND